MMFSSDPNRVAYLGFQVAYYAHTVRTGPPSNLQSLPTLVQCLTYFAAKNFHCSGATHLSSSYCIDFDQYTEYSTVTLTLIWRGYSTSAYRSQRLSKRASESKQGLHEACQPLS